MQLLNESPFIFTDVEGYTPHISRLLKMMSYVRRNTIHTVRHLSPKMLDALVLDNGNTIGMLLAHIAGVETWYQDVTFDGKNPAFDLPELQLGQAGLEAFQGHDNDADFYLERLQSVRAITLEQFAKRDDDWLHEVHNYVGDMQWSNFFCWFHVMEDELRHQGQIAILRKDIEGS